MILLCTKIMPFLNTIVSAITGAVIAIVAEPARQRFFGPKLNIDFDGNDTGYVNKTTEGQNNAKVCDAFYIRVKVTNTGRSIAKNCRAWLINIERQNQSGQFEKTGYCDAIQLAWSCQGTRDRYPPMDIYKGVNQYIDVIVTRNTSSDFDPQINCKPFRYIPLFKEKGKFLITIQVAGENANPEIIKLEFDWRGIWDNFTVRKVE